jgi:hypothetical protein
MGVGGFTEVLIDVSKLYKLVVKILYLLCKQRLREWSYRITNFENMVSKYSQCQYFGFVTTQNQDALNYKIKVYACVCKHILMII